MRACGSLVQGDRPSSSTTPTTSQLSSLTTIGRPGRSRIHQQPLTNRIHAREIHACKRLIDHDDWLSSFPIVLGKRTTSQNSKPNGTKIRGAHGIESTRGPSGAFDWRLVGNLKGSEKWCALWRHAFGKRDVANARNRLNAVANPINVCIECLGYRQIAWRKSAFRPSGRSSNQLRRRFVAEVKRHS